MKYEVDRVVPARRQELVEPIVRGHEAVRVVARSVEGEALADRGRADSEAVFLRETRRHSRPCRAGLGRGEVRLSAVRHSSAR